MRHLAKHMISALHNTAAWLLLLLHLSGGTAVELGHRHLASSGKEAAVAPHECGTHERHIPGEAVLQCPACSPGSVRAGFPPTVHSILPGVASREEIPPETRGALPFVLPFRSGDRAPPRTTS